ncbi:IS4 family transposase [Myxococcota bacterium]|nr:IS4 family transposase [Myxococcota bacterium]
MNESQFSEMVQKLNTALDIEEITRMGRESGFTERLREVTPHRLVLSLMCALATLRVESLADLLRTFNAVTGRSVQYKPFHNQLAKPEFPELMRLVLCHFLENLVLRVLEPVPDDILAGFEDIILQDGSSLAVRDSLADRYPGRFTRVSPAAVELHATVSVLRDQPIRISLAPDVQAERDFLPEPGNLARCLFMADRGYADIEYCDQVAQAGGSFIIRFKENVAPQVVACFVAESRCTDLERRSLNAIRNTLRGVDADLDVSWRRGDRTISMRLVWIWNPTLRKHMVLATNLDRRQVSLNVVRRLYSLRWQVDLLFKEWKSYANLHRFQTDKEGIVVGLMWASLAAALLKRFLAHATRAVFEGVETSTRRTAMALHRHLLPLVENLLRSRSIRRVLNELLQFLSTNATRAHPKRDRGTGRLQVGLQPVT